MRILLDSCCDGDEGGGGCNCGERKTKYQTHYLEAPNQIRLGQIKDWGKAVFLGGSITGSWNWQDRAKDILLPHLHVINPRRASYNFDDKALEREQIFWEDKYLCLAGINLFYFSPETLAPITLFETGKMLEKLKISWSWRKIYICIHPEYKRKNDVLIQTEIQSLDTYKNITFNLDECLDLIIGENN